jgi:hypothetical protein
MKGKSLRLLSGSVIAVVACAALALQLTGCSNPGGEFKENQPPTVWLSSAPPEGTVESYTINMHWGGWDPDGVIGYYEYCITDNENQKFNPADTVGADKWLRVYANDSTFTFTADKLVDTNTTDLVTDFTRSHTFFIRAVDSEGLPSPKPAYRSFTAYTLSPRVRIEIPRKWGFNPALVPPITTFTWVGEDFVSDMRFSQDPDSVSYLVEPLKNHNNSYDATIDWIRELPVDAPEWSSWVWYSAPNDSGKRYTTPPLDLGLYMFAVRAKDEAGAITPVFDEDFNVRRINVSKRTTGPLLVVQNVYLGSVRATTCNVPLSIMDIFAGIPMEFRWEADARSYGGTVVGYRYGWDIKDLNDPEQWDVSFTPFPPHPSTELPKARSTPRTFYYGTHVFTIEVRDNSGFCSRIEVKVNVVQFTLGKPLLIVDDYAEPKDVSGWDKTGVSPTDAEHDAFWASMASNISGFDPAFDVIDVTGQTAEGVPLAKIADYNAIIWNTTGDISQNANFAEFYDLVSFRPKTGAATSGKQKPNSVALFMAVGGKMMICGRQPISNVINRARLKEGVRLPIIWKYELDLITYSQTKPPTQEQIDDPPGDQSLAYLDLCLETMDLAAYPHYQILRNLDYTCEVATSRPMPPSNTAEYTRTRTMRAAEPLDPGFPRLDLRPEAAGPGKWYSPEFRGLNSEVYNPQYFFDVCLYISGSRDCFEPIYGLDCIYTAEPTYMQPVAFLSKEYADSAKVAEGVFPAPSVVFGFPPVFCDTTAVRGAFEHIFFDVWQLPEN